MKDQESSIYTTKRKFYIFSSPSALFSQSNTQIINRHESTKKKTVSQTPILSLVNYKSTCSQISTDQ